MSLLNKILRKLKTEGLPGIVSAIRLRLRPPRIRGFRLYRPLFLNASGLEIGGPSLIFSRRGLVPIYPLVAHLDGCNFNAQTMWEGKIQEGQTYAYAPRKKKGRQFILEATDLAAIASGIYDFVAASHILEHTANPLKALREWLRVLKDEGVLLLVIPHRDGAFDHRRQLTSFAHLLEDFANDTREDDMTHAEEFMERIDLAGTAYGEDRAGFVERTQRNLEFRGMHHHVFDTALVLRLFDYFNLRILAVDVERPFHIIVLGQKVAAGVSCDNSRFFAGDAPYKHVSPFPSDHRVAP